MKLPLSFLLTLTTILPAFLLLGLALAGCESGEAPAPAPVASERAPFGTTPDGEPVEIFTLRNANGMTARITNYGGNVVSLTAPDREGRFEDITLGFDSLAPYTSVYSRFGAIIGRYGNRIAKGRFTLDGQEYTLAVNNGNNHIHGGLRGFDKRVWNAELLDAAGDEPALRLTYRSPDGEEGYPGTLDVTVVYRLTNDNELRIEYEAVTDKPTPLNLTNHTWFDLSAGRAENVLHQEVMIDADRYVPVDDEQIPTGELRPVEGTPFDFRSPKPIAEDIDEVPGGYDHTFVLNRDAEGALARAAVVRDSLSGRTLVMETTEPGVQFYTGNGLDGSITGKGGRVYNRHAGLCLEAQHFPDSPNQPDFPDTVLRPGETYRQTTIYRFGVEGP